MADGTTPDHLTVVTSERGFARLPSIPSAYGGDVAVYESSAASGPHIWLKLDTPVDLNDPAGPHQESFAHLTAADAAKLADQLRLLVDGHYQTR